jgi:N-acylneuraminate cytidylyltransferase
MIHWPISAALESISPENIVVSTEDREIAEVAVSAGASVPFTRPAELADNHAGTSPVIVHALDALEIADDTAVMCLYPTAPIPSWTLSEALALAQEHSDDFVVSLGRHRSPHERAIVPASEGRMALEDSTALLSRTQDLPQRYFDAGKFYVASASTWRSRNTMMAEPFVPFFLPDWAAVDMDEPDDWPVAEALHRAFVREAP